MEKEVRDIVIAKAKILTVSDDGPKWGEGKSKSSSQVIIQNEEDQAKVYTALCFSDPMPESVKAGATLENITVQEEKSGDRTQYRVRFGEKKPFNKGGGYTPVKEDPVLKCVGLAYSYTYTIMLQTNTEPWDWEDYKNKASELAADMVSVHKVLTQ